MVPQAILSLRSDATDRSPVFLPLNDEEIP